MSKLTENYDASSLEIKDLYKAEEDDCVGSPPEKPSPASKQSQHGDAMDHMLVFDFETIPDESRMESFELEEVHPAPPRSPVSECPHARKFMQDCKAIPDVKAGLRDVYPDDEWLDEIEACESLRDKPRKGVFDEIDKFKKYASDREGAVEDRQRLLSTTPEYCRLAAMGWSVGAEEVESVAIRHDDVEMGGKAHSIEEKVALESFWDLVEDCFPLIGYNILYFDIPVALVRSMILGVRPTRCIDRSAWGKDCIDLYLQRFGAKGNSGKGRPGKLKQLCGLYGIPVPAEDVDGSQVYELYKTDAAKLLGYVESDVVIERKLFYRMSGYFFA